MTINDGATYVDGYQKFKDALLSFPEVEAIAGSRAVPGKNYLDLDEHTGIRLATATEDQTATFSSTYADDGFVEVYDLKLLAGRNYDTDKQIDKEAILINESALKSFGLNNANDAIGKRVDYQGASKEIVGVLADYHHKSLQHAYEPMIIRNFNRFFLYWSIQLKASNLVDIENTIGKIERSWAEMYPNDPFNYFFLDDHFNEQYLAEQRLSRIIMLFAGLAILIACLGLFGLASYVMTTRTKEIGIRKVLGASVTGIVTLLSKDFVKLIIIAIAIAIPVAWYVMQQWLQGFAYRITIQWWLFVIAAVLTIGIAIMTIGFQSLKAAMANPVDSIQNE